MSVIHVKDQDPDAAVLQVVVVIRVRILHSRNRHLQQATQPGARGTGK